jgi:hypothetical protein
MHISLDSALGRQRRLNSVGESVFQIAPNAAAGYSLRSLTGGDPAVVRVRRESDNAERDFNASGVSSGELVNWVNQQITPPLDLRELTATGRDGPIIDAAAAYSLRNLSDSYTGNVVEVRRNTDGALKDFKASEVTDGTLEAWVNTSFANALPLDTASGAAAAYSLRNLSTGYTGNVVDVRRSSDDAPRSFTAAEVADGTLTDWVNTDVSFSAGNDFFSSTGVVVINATPTAFDATSAGGTFDVRAGGQNYVGAGASEVTVNFTVSNFSSSQSIALEAWTPDGSGTYVTAGTITGNGAYTFTFDVTEDGTGSIFRFRGTGLTSGDTVSVSGLSLSWTKASGHVSQWYDQSGNDNHATQGTDASQPKIVSAGSLLNEIKFDGADDVLNFTEIDFSTNSWMLSAVVDWDGSVSPIVGGSTTQWSLQVATSDNFSSRATNDSTIHNFDPTSSIATGDGLFTVQRSSDVLSGYYDGVFDDAAPAITAASEFKADKIGQRGSLYGSSGVKEIIIYETDQSAKRIAIEENIGSNYGITVTSSKDGTVSTWYDQSTTAGTPNANHAVQTDAASQPKIVDAGSLVTGGIDFDGVNYGLEFDEESVITNMDDFSSFTVAKSNTTSGTKIALAVSDDTPNASRWYSPILIGGNFTFGYGTSATAVSLGTADTNEHLFSSIAGSTTAEAWKDGTSGGSVSSVTTAPSIVSGINLGGSNNALLWNGSIKEIILYNTDQSNNRTALEANIGEVYSIAGIPAYDDTVNGFVETWYDQSGNDNDAVQFTASSQPKIVSAGALVQEGGNASLEFDGVDDYLATTQGYIVEISQNPASVFAIANPDTIADGYLLTEGDSVTGYSSSFILNGASVSTVWVNTTRFGSGFPASLTLGGFIYDGTNFQAYLNGSADGASGTAAINAETSIQSYIGTRADGTTDFFAGKLSEIITYKSDQSANRVAIEANINNQYDIY